MATGGPGPPGGGVGGAGGNFPSPSPSSYRVKPLDLVQGFVRRTNRQATSTFSLSPTRRRRAHSTSSSTSTLSHNSSYSGLMDTASWASSSAASSHPSLHGIQGQYGAFRSSPAGILHRKRSLGDSSTGHPSPRLTHSMMSAAAAASGAMATSPQHPGARNSIGSPVVSAYHPPASHTVSAPHALSSQLVAASHSASYMDEYGEDIHEEGAAQDSSYQRRGGRQSNASTPSGEGPCLVLRGATQYARAEANSSRSASVIPLPRPPKAVPQFSIDDGYDGSSECLQAAGATAAATATRPKSKQDKDGKKPKFWKETLSKRRHKSKPDAKRRDDGGLSDIAASAAASQCTTPVPIAAEEEGAEDPIAVRKTSTGRSASPPSDRDDGKRKGEGSLFDRLRPKFARNLSRGEANGNLSDGASDDTSKKKKKKSTRKKKGHSRHKSEDLNNNDPRARNVAPRQGATSAMEHEHPPSSPSGGPISESLLRRAAAAAASAAAAPDLASSNAVDPLACNSDSDEAASIVAASGGDFDEAASMVSGLRDDFSQDLLLDSYPTPGSSNPATPALHRPDASREPKRSSRRYSSDVDTGEASYDAVADSDSIGSAPSYFRGGGGSRRRLDSSASGGNEKLEACIDQLTDLSNKIERKYASDIEAIVRQLIETDDYRDYELYADYARQLLDRLCLGSTEHNVAVLLLMTTRLLTSLPEQLNYLAVEIEQNSSRLLKEQFFEFFYAGTERALSFIRRSLRRRDDTGAPLASAAASSSGSAVQHATSPLAAPGDTSTPPALRLRGAAGGMSARESHEQRIRRTGAATESPVPRLRQAQSAPGLDSHLDDNSGNTPIEDEQQS